MNETNENYVNYSQPAPASPAAPAVEPAPEPVTWRDIAAPILALALSLLFWAVFAFDRLLNGWGPGLGIPVFTAAYFLAVFLMIKPRRSAGGFALMAAALVLSVCCALYAHIGFTVINCLMIPILSAMATFSLSGQNRFGAMRLRAIPEAVKLMLLALFTRIARPFRLIRFKKRGGAAAVRAVIAVAVSCLLLAVVIALLASADMVFGSLFARLREWLEALDPATLLWRVLRTVVLALLFASGLYFVREEPSEPKAADAAERERHAGPFLLPTLLLDLVYTVFCAIQLRYLFGGADAAAMAGGWAEYARTGFFQLVAVAAINLATCLLGADCRRFAAKGGAVLRAADALLLLLTAVILASAVYRMHLYIAAFGMSTLRLMTLWGMLVIAVGLALAAWKLIRPDFAFFPGFFGFALTTWCLLCLANPAGRIAFYNVDAYLDGRLEQADVWYLELLSPDAAPALRRLAEESDDVGSDARRALNRLTLDADEAIPWTNWKLSFRIMEKNRE